MPLRVGVSWHLTLWMPSPSTTTMNSTRLLRTTTSMVLPGSVMRTLILSVCIAVSPVVLASIRLLDLGLGAKLGDKALDARALQALGNVALDFGQRRMLGIARVFELDHVEAEPRLDRHLGIAALGELDHRVGEILVEGAR